MTHKEEIEKLEFDRKLIIFKYEYEIEKVEKAYTEKLTDIDNKLFELKRIGFRIPIQLPTTNKPKKKKL